MEVLGNALFLDMVPDTWLKKAYPSMYGLASWYTDLLLRVRELESWISDFQLPPSVWLGGFFNPQSFLTAIMQQVCLSVTDVWPAVLYAVISVRPSGNLSPVDGGRVG